MDVWHTGAGRAVELPGLAAFPAPPQVPDLRSCCRSAKKHRGAVEILSELVHMTAVTRTVIFPAALPHLSKHLPKPWPRKEK